MSKPKYEPEQEVTVKMKVEKITINKGGVFCHLYLKGAKWETGDFGHLNLLVNQSDVSPVEDD